MKFDHQVRAVLLLFGLVATCVHGAGSSIEEFTRIGTLTDGEESMRRVELPFQLLKELTRSDLGDVHVFDAQGQLVPSNTYYLQSREETLASEVELQFFPFGAEGAEDAIRYSLQVDQNKRDTHISLSTDEALSVGERPKTNYVIHIPKETRRQYGVLSQLELAWNKPDENLILPIRVEGSADLRTWRTLTEQAVVTDLEHNGASLVTNTIELLAFPATYLRLTWPASVVQFDLLGIRGEFTRSRVSPAQLRRHSIPCMASKLNICQFEIPPQLVVQSISMPTKLSQYFWQGTFFSARQRNSEWLRRGNFQQYQLLVDAQEINNSVQRLPNTRDRHWQLRFDQPPSDVGVQAVEVQWYPVYQAFMAQGRGPYQLAYGNPDVSNATGRTMDTILARAKKHIEEIETVYLGEVRTFERISDYWTKQRIEVFVLWAVLILGVAVLFGIAWKLFRNLNPAAGE